VQSMKKIRLRRAAQDCAAQNRHQKGGFKA
jgi:hypothetical protein